MSLFEEINAEEDVRNRDVLNDAPQAGDQGKIEIRPPEKATICVGHEQQEKHFLDLFNHDAIPHAVIFSGLKGIGKTTFAFRLARFLLKHGKTVETQNALFGDQGLPQNATTLDVDPSDPVFARVASGGHADMLHIHREFDATKNKQDTSLKVDNLRRIEHFLRKTASEGGWRIVLVEDADTMNRNAQNAILKILEEPPPKVLIVLITHRPGVLIPTIKSRSRTVKFNPLDERSLNELLQKKDMILSIEEMQIVTDMSEGSFGRALKIVEEGGITTLSKITDILSSYPKWRWYEIHQIANRLGPSAQDREYKLFVETLIWIFRKIVFIKAQGQNTLPKYLGFPAMEDYFNQTPLEKMLEIADNLNAHFSRTDFSNLDRKDAVRHAFTVIHE